MDKYYVYKIFNVIDFQNASLVSRNYYLELEDIGLRDILVTLGNIISITYEGIMLGINLNDYNPFEFEGHMVYQTQEGDVYLGILKPPEELALLEALNVSEG